MPKSRLWFVFLLVLCSLLLSCGGSDGGVPDDAALKITGSVDKAIGWTEDQVLNMDAIESEATNKDGELKTYTGVPINALLKLVTLNDNAESLLFITGDENTAEVSLSEIKSCPDCIVSFRNQGGFSLVLPGFSSNLQVKDLIEIEVK